MHHIAIPFPPSNHGSQTLLACGRHWNILGSHELEDGAGFE